MDSESETELTDDERLAAHEPKLGPNPMPSTWTISCNPQNPIAYRSWLLCVIFPHCFATRSESFHDVSSWYCPQKASAVCQLRPKVRDLHRIPFAHMGVAWPGLFSVVVLPRGRAIPKVNFSFPYEKVAKRLACSAECLTNSLQSLSG